MTNREFVRISGVLFVALALLASPALAGSVNLQWDPSSGATGYRVFAGSASGSYGTPSNVGNTTQMAFDTMADCTATFFAVKAFNSAGDSEFSDEIFSWPRPEATSLNPLEVEQGVTVNLIIGGNNFEPGSSVQVSNPGITVNSVTRDSCGQITASLTVAGSAASGPFDVSVVNTNGVTGTSSVQLTVVGSPLPDVQNLRRTDKQ